MKVFGYKKPEKVAAYLYKDANSFLKEYTEWPFFLVEQLNSGHLKMQIDYDSSSCRHIKFVYNGIIISDNSYLIQGGFLQNDIRVMLKNEFEDRYNIEVSE